MSGVKFVCKYVCMMSTVETELCAVEICESCYTPKPGSPGNKLNSQATLYMYTPFQAWASPCKRVNVIPQDVQGIQTHLK